MNSEAILLLARAFSAQGLYEAGHPARNRALASATRSLAGSRSGSVTFLDGRVIVGGVPEPKLQGWSWGLRLESAGVRRIEVDGEVTEEDVLRFLEELALRLESPDGPVVEVRCGALRFSPAGVESTELRQSPLALEELPAFTLHEESEVVTWVFEELRAGRSLDMLEVDLVVRSWMAVMQGGGMFLVPLVRLRDFDQYTTAHSMNVSVLSMALAEFLGLDSSEVRGIGVAGILHDIGKIRVPKEVLVKPGKLTAEEMDLIRQHPVDGARMILSSDDRLELAATMAYEHHVWFRGGGVSHLRLPPEVPPRKQPPPCLRCLRRVRHGPALPRGVGAPADPRVYRGCDRYRVRTLLRRGVSVHDGPLAGSNRRGRRSVGRPAGGVTGAGPIARMGPGWGWRGGRPGSPPGPLARCP